MWYVASEENQAYLAHHGVKGMKWGVRNRRSDRLIRKAYKSLQKEGKYSDKYGKTLNQKYQNKLFKQRWTTSKYTQELMKGNIKAKEIEDKYNKENANKKVNIKKHNQAVNEYNKASDSYIDNIMPKNKYSEETIYKLKERLHKNYRL